MSYSDKPKPEKGLDSLSDQLRSALSCEDNKPDSKQLDLGSPVSPLTTRRSGRGGRATSGLTTTSSSSSSSGSVSGKTANPAVVKRSDVGRKSHSGELSGSSGSSPTAAESTRSGSATRNYKPGHARSNSGGAPLIYSGGSVASGGGCGGSVNSPTVNVLPPTGNICPSGKILKTGMATKSSPRRDVLGSGTGNYGHGSIMRGGVSGGKLGGGSSSGGEASPANVTGNKQFAGESMTMKNAMGASWDLETVTKAGNEQYKKGNLLEALSLYDRAISISPGNAACRNNRAAALATLGRLTEAVKECEAAVRLDPAYGRAHQRLASLHLRLGQTENARKHLFLPGQKPDPVELQKLKAMERHLKRCADARKMGDWKNLLKEVDAAIAAGGDYSPQLFACRVEAFLKLHHLEDADSGLSSIPKFEPATSSCSQTTFCGFYSEAYLYFVRAQVDMTMGRFENAVAAAEKAVQLDPGSFEIAVMLNNVKLVASARARGNDLFKAGMFDEACSAYVEGFKGDPFNSVLHCNRAACWSKLGQWERSIDDCNQALRIRPKYTKALLRRAASYLQLERWAESVRDYEVLRKELPGDNEVAEALFHAQVALKNSRGEEVYNMKFGGEVEKVLGLDQFRAEISSPGVSVVHFKAASNKQCEQISPFVDTLCHRYPSVNFVKVDVEESPEVAKAENVRIVPTFKIYKKGSRVKEMICPTPQVLESSVRHYSL
ncbi:TPR repeat-containing thioredoxin TTL1-like isoform X1 [Telopea speciosissima]|uniref:TPR repeat-containing thioredoxin TTL1-like isoform X1 n=1 Tax=Telopea speciosissima TaxID=54955 RepID=UPI001CC6E7B8|nr:TPR repeat-containing thioredoxin TTL1-like isoform X1 [Telopea speciosissima]